MERNAKIIIAAEAIIILYLLYRTNQLNKQLVAAKVPIPRPFTKITYTAASTPCNCPVGLGIESDDTEVQFYEIYFNGCIYGGINITTTIVEKDGSSHTYTYTTTDTDTIDTMAKSFAAKIQKESAGLYTAYWVNNDVQSGFTINCPRSSIASCNTDITSCSK